MKETWLRETRVSYTTIEIEDATVDVLLDNRADPTFITRDVAFVDVGATWEIGSDEAKLRVRIWVYGGRIPKHRAIVRETTQLREIPDWLTDIVSRATAHAGVHAPELQPYRPQGLASAPAKE